MRFAISQAPQPIPPPHEYTPPTQRPDAPAVVKRFFEVIREEDPAEFERLQRLRETNRAAFRAEIANLIRRERNQIGFPQFDDGGSPPRGAGSILKRARLARKEGHVIGDPMRVYSPELERLERRARELARAVREAENDQQRERAMAELRDVLNLIFDKRQQLRYERIQHVRARLDDIEKRLAERAANRNTIIEHRLRYLIDGPDSLW
jgi:hypothetical protein